MPNSSIRARRPCRVASGFTLIEAMIATPIVGVAVTSLLAIMAPGTRASDDALLMTRGVFIAQQMRERLVLLPYSDPQTGDTTCGPEESATGYFRCPTTKMIPTVRPSTRLWALPAPP